MYFKQNIQNLTFLKTQIYFLEPLERKDNLIITLLCIVNDNLIVQIFIIIVLLNLYFVIRKLTTYC